ncbi:MAG TPA: hypothetical protein VKT30_13735 [Caulobacteraceae bacterium]|nr:hypothetical protein [Caulobacteraceae bacterium]
MADAYESFGDKVHAYNCAPHLIRDLGDAEIQALMAYQRHFRDGLRDLYKHMDPEAADRFVKKLYLELAHSLKD